MTMLLVRTDANAAIGMGHAVRCLALAEAWIARGGKVTFAMENVPASLVDRLASRRVRVERVRTIEDVVSLAKALRAERAVVDGYTLGAPVQDALATAGCAVMVIDDDGRTATKRARWVLNQNPHATRELYAGLDAKLLLGLDHALLRPEFVNGAPARVVPERASRVLVTMGGADPAGLTARVLEVIGSIEDIETRAVIGPANPRAAELETWARSRQRTRVELSVDDMTEPMRWADLAIVAAGSTCWELARMGTPMLAIAVADNQRPVATALGPLGIGRSLGDVSSATPGALRDAIGELVVDLALRTEMSRRGPAAVDGRGAERVCDSLMAANGGAR